MLATINIIVNHYSVIHYAQSEGVCAIVGAATSVVTMVLELLGHLGRTRDRSRSSCDDSSSHSPTAANAEVHYAVLDSSR